MSKNCREGLVAFTHVAVIYKQMGRICRYSDCPICIQTGMCAFVVLVSPQVRLLVCLLPPSHTIWAQGGMIRQIWVIGRVWCTLQAHLLHFEGLSSPVICFTAKAAWNHFSRSRCGVEHACYCPRHSMAVTIYYHRCGFGWGGGISSIIDSTRPSFDSVNGSEKVTVES